MNRILWVLQVLLALLFIFAGAMKFVMSVADMTKDMPSISGDFLHFIGACEILGGLGLVLPRALKIKQWLTPLAAALLFVIMIGATVMTLPGGPKVAALPAVTGILCAFVAYGRWKVAP